MTPANETRAYARMRLGRNIERLRRAKGLTQAALARQMGIDQRCLSHWEHGRRVPTIESLHQLHDELGCTWEELMS